MYTVPKPVNRCPLRAAYVGATLSTLLTLVTAQGAGAHVDVQPRLVEQGESTQLRVELPQLRPGPAPERIEVEGAGNRDPVDPASRQDGVGDCLERARARRRATGRGAADSAGRVHRRRGRRGSDSLTVFPARVVVVPLGSRRRRHAPGACAGARLAAPRPSPDGVIASPLVLFQQFLDDDLGCASYLVGDEDAGVAAIVDPPYAIDRVLEAAGRRDVEIVRVIETHTHADHLSATAGSRSSTGSRCRSTARQPAEYPHDAPTTVSSWSSARSSCAPSTRPGTGPSTRASPSSTARVPTSPGSC